MSNHLPVLAAAIRAAHEAAMATARTSIEKAVEAGRLLIEAKDALPHGGWLPWLRDVGITPRTAQRYVRLAAIPPDKYDTVSHLGIKGALDAIAKKVSPTQAALDELEAAITQLEALIAGLNDCSVHEKLSRLARIANEDRALEAAFEYRRRCERILGKFLAPLPDDLEEAKRITFELLQQARGALVEAPQYDDIRARLQALSEAPW